VNHGNVVNNNAPKRWIIPTTKTENCISTCQNIPPKRLYTYQLLFLKSGEIYTPPKKIYIEPENDGFQKESPFPGYSPIFG